MKPFQSKIEQNQDLFYNLFNRNQFNENKAKIAVFIDLLFVCFPTVGSILNQPFFHPYFDCKIGWIFGITPF
jgi:hypothetical protein